MDRDEFFAQLDQLTTKEIENRLSSWDKEQLVLVQEYLDQQVVKATAAHTDTSAIKDAVRTSVEVGRRAHTMATMALIFSIGAMLAAIAAAVSAFLALRGWTISW
jgi:hypothetical protein